MHKIDGTREIETVWIDTNAAIEAMEATLVKPVIREFAVHVYLSEPDAPTTPKVVEKLSSDVRHGTRQCSYASQPTRAKCAYVPSALFMRTRAHNV